MLPFDSRCHKYPSRRNTLFASRGMVCTSVPQASSIGLEILKKGGNAMDAAVAVAAALPLLEPASNGLGSDAFAQIWTNGRLYALNASGHAPMSLSAGLVRDLGYSAMPDSGWLPVMVPGAPAAWAEINRRFGRLSLAELFAPAVDYAENGFAVSCNVARIWEEEAVRFAREYKNDPALFAPWRDSFTKNGEPYREGDIFRCPDMAATLRELAATGCESYYRGALMSKIVDFSRQTGGYLSEDDFTGYRPRWVEPISTRYRGCDVYELPPNGHGITVLMALNILEGMQLGERDDPETWHKLIEALKLAFIDAQTYVADPRFMRTRVADLLSPGYAASRRALIGSRALMPVAGDPACGDTVYFCTADGEGNMVSYIQSNYKSFGSGVVIPGTGISLQDRGANFSLDESSDNCLAGGKKAYHTIIPGFLARDGQAIGPFGVMGGFMQPQGHLQILVNTIDYGMSPQQALDAPRFQWVGGKRIQVEAEAPSGMAEALRGRGHETEVITDSLNMGRGQIIRRLDNGVLAGGTEPRCDGAAAVW